MEQLSVPASGSASRRRRIFLLLGGAALALVVGGWWWLHQRGPEPPDIVLKGVDPAVAEAVTEARQEVLREPHSAEAWGGLGMVLRAHDFAGEANRCFVEAARLDPMDARWPYLHALTLWFTDPDAALALLERAAELGGDARPEVRLRLAENLMARGRLDEAEKHFRRVLEQDAGQPRAHLGLGRLAYQRDQLDACVDHLRLVAGHPCARRSARSLLAEVYQRRKDRSALQKLGSVAGLPADEMWPDRFVAEVERLRVGMKALINQALDLVRQGQAPKGIDILRETAACYPEAERAWFFLGQTLNTVKSFPAAEEALARAVALVPGSLEAWFQLGISRFRQGKYSEAADAFEKVIQLKVNHGLAHYNLGQCRKQLGDRPGAMAAFRAALRYKPDNVPAQKELDQLLKGEQK
jgi:tetratricopeptide (TPR) repeat protein